MGKPVVTKTQNTNIILTCGSYQITLYLEDGKFIKYEGPEDAFLEPAEILELLKAVGRELEHYEAGVYKG